MIHTVGFCTAPYIETEDINYHLEHSGTYGAPLLAH